MNDEPVVMGQTVIKAERTRAAPQYDVRIVEEVRELEEEWNMLERQWTSSGYQSYFWVKAAYEIFETGNRPVVVHVTAGNTTVLLLPLVLVKGLPSVLRWPGNNHCNIGCGLFSRSFLEAPDPALMPLVLDTVRKHVAGPAILHLKNQPTHLAGFPNPLLQFEHQPGPNPLYVMDLTLGLDGLLDLGNGARKRRAFRRQKRRAEEMGGYELVIPTDRPEILETLELFFSVKAERLQELGVSDVFEPDNIREFMAALATASSDPHNNPLMFYVLKVNGKPRAMYGTIAHGKRCFSCVNAVVFDDFAGESPGEMILYLMLEDLIERGFDYFDIGIGQERYKLSWCKDHRVLMETVKPLGATSMPFAALMRYRTRLKHQIKSNDFIWANVKRLRRSTTGS